MTVVVTHFRAALLHARSFGFAALAALAALTAVAALAPPVARAQQTPPLASGGFDLHLFRPAVDSKGHLTVNGTDVLGAGDISFGLVLDGGFGVMPVDAFVSDGTRTAADAERIDRLVNAMFTGTLHFNYGIANLLVVGAQVPVQVLDGPNATLPGAYNDRASARGLSFQGLGDVVLHAKVRLLRAERDPVGLAAILHLELPTGDPSSFAGEPGLALWPVLAAEWRPVRALRFSANLGYRFVLGDGATLPVGGRTRPSSMSGNATVPLLEDPGASITYDDVATFGFGASLRVMPAMDLVAEVYGNQIVSELGTEHALSMEAIGGVKVFVERNSYLVIGGGAGFLGGYDAATYRAMLGFVFEPSIGDRDGDGFKDDVDQCPDEPEDYDDFSDDDGCPEPDNDRDGILDVDDECPLVPEDRDGDADDDGCPEGNEGDRDGDGILDNADQCPDDPEDRDNFQDEDGCPDPDNDQDQILDGDDLCPNDPEDRDDFEDDNGCPDPDNDQDRILDASDTCPNVPETYNGTEDQDGCPDHGIVTEEGNEYFVLQQILFETDSAEILPQSFNVLDAVAAAINGNPRVTLVEVQGHADERAADDYNIRLTRDRAAAVVEGLVQRGVARERLRSAGYGERCPADLRHNARAWEANRRVLFKILRTDEGPTSVEIACPAGRELIPQ